MSVSCLRAPQPGAVLRTQLPFYLSNILCAPRLRKLGGNIWGGEADSKKLRGNPMGGLLERGLGGMVFTCVPLPCAYPTSWHNSHTPSNTSWCRFLQEAFPDLQSGFQGLPPPCGVLGPALALLPVRCLYLHFSWGLGSFRVEAMRSASPRPHPMPGPQYMPHTLVM